MDEMVNGTGIKLDDESNGYVLMRSGERIDYIEPTGSRYQTRHNAIMEAQKQGLYSSDAVEYLLDELECNYYCPCCDDED